MWFEWDDEGISVVIWADDIKSRHLKRDPRATILVAESNPPYRGIEIRGEASVSSPDDVMPKVRRMAIRYMGEEAGNTYADSFVGHALEEVRIRSGNIRSWDFSDDLD